MSTALSSGWVPDDSSLAARLALVRQRMGWSEAQAERECGLPKNKWSRLEDGKTARDTNIVVKRIADVTGVDLGWLAFGLHPVGGESLPHLDSNQEPSDFRLPMARKRKVLVPVRPTRRIGATLPSP